MNCNCDKQICYQVPVLNGDEDFGTLTATDGIYTSKIYDACGNLRIDLACNECDGSGDCTDVVKGCDGSEIQIVSLIEKATGAVIPFQGCDQINAILRAGNGNCWKVQTVDGTRLNLNSIKCCERLCEDLPTTIHGGLYVDGNICADTIGCCDLSVYDENGVETGTKCTDLIGNGCQVTNTDNTEIIDVVYHPDNKYNEVPDTNTYDKEGWDDNPVEGGEIVITQKNTKDCDGFDPAPTLFKIDTGQFTHNTWVNSFGFVPDEASDELVLTDTDGREYHVDLEKYNNKQETYIDDKNYKATTDGVITLDYNTDSPMYGQHPVIDISDAMRTIAYTEYDKCTGKLTLCHDSGECIIQEGLPTNIDVKGKLDIGAEWSGSVWYHIRDNVIMVNVDVRLGNNWPYNNNTPSLLGKLPVRLANYITSDDITDDDKEFYVYKWIAGQSTTSVPSNYPYDPQYQYVPPTCGPGPYEGDPVSAHPDYTGTPVHHGNYASTSQGFVYVGMNMGDYIYDGYISPAVSYNNMVQLAVSINGTMNIKLWQRPMIIQDTFTLVIDGIDKEFLQSKGLLDCPTSTVPHTVTYHTNYHNTSATQESIPYDFIGDQYRVLDCDIFTLGCADSDGNAFRFWNTMPDGSGVTFHPDYYADNITSDFSLYAIWDSAFQEYNVVYVANNGFPGQVESATFRPISGLRILRGDFFSAPSGKTFVEWNTIVDGTGDSYTPGEIVTLYEDIMLYGIWS